MQNITLRISAIVIIATIILGFSGGIGLADTAAVSHEALPEVVTEEYIDETIEMIKDVNMTLPIERINYVFNDWKEKSYGPYRNELRELGAENADRINFGAKMLYTYDYMGRLYINHAKLTLENYLPREVILDYVLTGENEDVFYDPEGRPLFWQVNMTYKMKETVKEACSLLSVIVENFYDYLFDGGMCVLMTEMFDEDRSQSIGQAVLYIEGIIIINITEESIADRTIQEMTNAMARTILMESLGINYGQLIVRALDIYHYSSGEITTYLELFKDFTCGGILRSGKDIDGLAIYSYGSIIYGQRYIDEVNGDVNREWVKREKEMMLAVLDLKGDSLIFEAMLDEGDDGYIVQYIKTRLQELGYFKSEANLSTQYNATCTERVKLFQQANELPVTGVMDEQTYIQLYSDDAIANPN